MSFVLVILMADPLCGQIPASEDREITLLPAPTGEPLTIVPLDSPDIECAIQEWNVTRPQPYVKLLCPPMAVYAPLRVYIKLSWLKPEDVVYDPEKIIARRQQSTWIRASSHGVKVRMETSVGDGNASRMRWIEFNALVDMALITGQPTRH